MQEILKGLLDLDKTLVVSSHILPELSRMCTSVGVIQAGKMVLCGGMEEIMSLMASANPLVISLTDKVDQAVEYLKQQPLVATLSYKDHTVRVDFKGDSEDEVRLLSQMVQIGLPVSSFSREEGSLEALFLQITSQTGGGIFYAN